MSQPERRPINELIDEARDVLNAVDPADTTAAITALWCGLCVVGAAGNILAICSTNPDYPVLFDNAEPVLAAGVKALRTAPSLPRQLSPVLNPAGGPDDELDDEQSKKLHAGILGLAGLLNTVAPEVARHAAGSDAKACRDLTMLASELYDCYTGRLRTFLNRSRTSFGPGSFVVRGHGHGNRDRKRRK